MRGPDVGDLARGIAAEVALVRPQSLVLVKVLGREHVHRQRLHSGRRTWKCRSISPSETAPRGGRTLCRSLRLRVIGRDQPKCGQHHEHSSRKKHKHLGFHGLHSLLRFTANVSWRKYTPIIKRQKAQNTYVFCAFRVTSLKMTFA